MVRYGAILLIILTLCGCGREKIDAADRAALAAWEEFGRRIAGQAAALASFDGVVCDRIPEEKENCRPLREAVQAAGKIEFAGLDLTDKAVVEPVRRVLRSLDQQAARLAQYPKKYPQLTADDAVAKRLEGLKPAAEELRGASERYDAAVLIYNRALRTFPESVTNNMFLRLKSREYLNTDQRSRNTPARRGVD